ncbi:MAG: ABC transporter permease [Muribaculaceae bacterium]|nr:ABC transporter permease [Muribaculaceae bacterium]
MKLSLSARIAWRYLRAKKSHSAVGAISVVSVCGIAVATAAIICVLSVFNGFKSVIAGRVDTLTPDVMITPSSGKVFADGDSLAAAVAAIPEVATAMPTILDNALAIYGGRETPVSLKGADAEGYAKLTSINSLIVDKLPAGAPVPVSIDDEGEEIEMQRASIAVGASARLGAAPGSRILLFAPRREGRVNLANPAASFLRDSVQVASVYQTNQSEFDENRVVVGIDLARDLLQYDTEASAVEVKGKPGIDSSDLADIIRGKLNPPGSVAVYIVKDRLQQQEMNFRMISIEKWVTFLLLFFILVIASFNIISSLSMLVIEKEKSLSTLKALGMTKGSVASVFRWESLFVTAVGGIAGIIAGLILCILQQHFGIIRLQGDPQSLVVQAYPVLVDPIDILITAVPLVFIGTATAFITGAFAKSRC